MVSETKRILLVDDTKLFLELEGSFLQDSGYEVLVAQSAHEALEMAKVHRPDLILLDLNMPDMDGDVCCRQIKNDPDLKDIAVIMVTGSDTLEDRKRCIEAGCDGYLTKTVNRGALLKTIARGLHGNVLHEPRLPINVPVRYAPLHEEEAVGMTMNISARGMFIITDQPPAIGTKIRLEFQLPGTSSSLDLNGEVLWNTIDFGKGLGVKGFGLQFIQVDDKTVDQITRYIEERKGS